MKPTLAQQQNLASLLVSAAGGTRQLAARVGVTQRTVQRWSTKGVPARKVDTLRVELKKLQRNAAARRRRAEKKRAAIVHSERVSAGIVPAYSEAKLIRILGDASEAYQRQADAAYMVRRAGGDATPYELEAARWRAVVRATDERLGLIYNNSIRDVLAGMTEGQLSRQSQKLMTIYGIQSLRALYTLFFSP